MVANAEEQQKEDAAAEGGRLPSFGKMIELPEPRQQLETPAKLSLLPQATRTLT